MAQKYGDASAVYIKVALLGHDRQKKLAPGGAGQRHQLQPQTLACAVALYTKW